MSFAVTGATGALGRLAVTALLERGVAPAEVVALVRTPARAADLAALGVQVRPFDYDAPQTLVPALAGVHRLLLISGNAVGQRVAQHTAVIEAARTAGVGHLTYTSILAADTTANPLAPEHLATEQALAASGLAYTLLRNGWYAENYTARVAEYVASGTIPHSTGGAALSLASRADFAGAAAGALLLDAPAVRYDLGGPAVTFEGLAAAVTAATGTTVVALPLSGADHVAALVAAGLDEGTAAFVAGIDAAIAAGDLLTDPAPLEALLGRPATPLATSLAAALA
ncbi:NAD(P)H-binding protein [Kineococcus gynurae]|uniref:NAD(P)H-binding protein n=1 Tax=Kineococcus gynurae TaxID=452979 RepID=A0ABV5LQ73_9ACTN